MFDAGQDFIAYFIKDFHVLIKRMVAWPPNVFHYFWVIVFIVIALAYMYYHKKEVSVLQRILNHMRNKQHRVEFKKDIFYFALRFLYRPLLYGVFLLNFDQIQSQLSRFFENKGYGFEYAIFHLDPVVGSLLMGFMIFAFKDFCDYINHYMQHKIKWMWYFHMSHHRSKSLSPLTKYRIHPGEYIQNGLIPLILEVPGILFIYSLFQVHGQNKTYTVMLFCMYAFHYSLVHFRHSHIPIHYGRLLSNFFLSPYMHHIHHSKNPKHHNKNFGVCLSIWDKIFNTHYIPEKIEPLEFGILEEEQQGKEFSFWGEINDPFLLMYTDIKKVLPKSNEKPQIKTALKKNQGFSLIELMVTVGISTVLFLGGSYMIINLVSLETTQGKITQVEEDLAQLEYIWRSLANNAANVRYRDQNLDGRSSNATGEGYARRFTYVNDASMPQASRTLMFFAREVRTSVRNPATLSSLYRPTGVFYVKKNVAQNQYGRVVFDLGQNDGANGVVAPDFGPTDMVFNNVSDLIIDQPQFSSARVLQSLRVNVTMIYSILSGDTNRSVDCLGPIGDVNNGIICNTVNTRPFKSLNKTFTLRFANNKRYTMIPGAEFEFGFYAFPPAKSF